MSLRGFACEQLCVYVCQRAVLHLHVHTVLTLMRMCVYVHSLWAAMIEAGIHIRKGHFSSNTKLVYDNTLVPLLRFTYILLHLQTLPFNEKMLYNEHETSNKGPPNSLSTSCLPSEDDYKGMKHKCFSSLSFYMELTSSQQRMMPKDVTQTTKKHFWGMHFLKIMLSEF